jgi:hypothetical protein
LKPTQRPSAGPKDASTNARERQEIRNYAANRWDEKDEFDETVKPKHFNKDTKWSEDPVC